MTALLLSLALLAPPGVHYQGTVGTGATYPAATGNSDTFNGAASTALSTHDAAWANLGDGTAFAVASCLLDGSGNVWPSQSWPSPDCGARYTTSTSDVSQITKAPSTAAISSLPVIMATVRSSATSRGYHCGFTQITGTDYITVILYKDGSWLNAGSGTWPIASSHTVRLVASGSGTVSLTCQIDGATVVTYSDSSSPIASGSPGFYMANENAQAEYKLESWTDQ